MLRVHFVYTNRRLGAADDESECMIVIFCSVLCSRICLYSCVSVHEWGMLRHNDQVFLSMGAPRLSRVKQARKQAETHRLCNGTEAWKQFSVKPGMHKTRNFVVQKFERPLMRSWLS